MTSSKELAEQAISLLQDALQDAEQRANDLDAELRKKRAPKNAIEKQVKVLEHRLESLNAECERWKRETAQLEEVLDNERAKAKQLQAKLDVAESGPDKVGKKEVNYWRSRAEQFDAETAEYKKRLAEQTRALGRRADIAGQLAEAQEEIRSKDARIVALGDEMGELRTRIDELEPQLEKLRAESTELGPLVEELRAKNAQLESQLAARAAELQDQLRVVDEKSAELAAMGETLAERDEALTDLNRTLGDRETAADERVAGLERELAARAGQNAEYEQRLAEAEARLAAQIEAERAADSERQRVQEQLAGLEEELKEEKDCTVNLSQLANERREEIRVLTERVEEAEERYQEARWKLERAARFERLLNKRRGLIDSLIAGLRAKQKANVALKAGLDGLRRFKASAEQQHQKLLVRIEELSGKLKASQERVVQNERARRVDDAQDNAVDELKATIQYRDETIARLEAELEKQRAAGANGDSVDGPESAAKSQQIEELKARILSLEAELESQIAAGPAAPDASETRRVNMQIGDLKRTLQEKEKEIAKLNEEVAGWQKKYEFLSTEAPSAYSAASAEK